VLELASGGHVAAEVFGRRVEPALALEGFQSALRAQLVHEREHTRFDALVESRLCLRARGQVPDEQCRDEKRTRETTIMRRPRLASKPNTRKHLHR
jgi:hypothetical protein